MHADDANLIVLEAILVGILLFGALYVIVSVTVPTAPYERGRQDVEDAGEDALAVLDGLPACDGLAGGERQRCLNAYGSSSLKRGITEALTGDARNVTNRLRTLLPSGVEWSLHLDNGVGTTTLRDGGSPGGERVTASFPIAPEWNLTLLGTHADRLNWTASGSNDLFVVALPLWKSRAVDPAEPVRVRFANGDEVVVDEPVVDGERGRLSTLADWRMNEGAGATIGDSRDRVDVSGVGGSRWVDGRVGMAIAFGGMADVLQVESGHLAAARVTASLWVRPDALPVDGNALLLKYTASDGDVLDVAIEAGTGLVVAKARSGSDSATATSDTGLEEGVWSHVAVAHGGNRLAVFLNGTREATVASPVSFPTGGAARVDLGGKAASGDPDSAAFDGRLDEVRLYDRVLADDEFSRLRRALVPPDRGASAGWDARTASPRSVTSLAAWDGSPMNGSARYRVGTDAVLADASGAILAGLNDSTIAAYRNGTWTRTARPGDEIAIEFDFRPLLDRLAADGFTFAAGSVNRTTVAVRAPVSQPPGVNAAFHETLNVTRATTSGYANFTLLRGAILGSHLVVATLDTTLQGATPQTVQLRKFDHVDVALPGNDAPPLNPLYRAVIEMWLPEWR